MALRFFSSPPPLPVATPLGLCTDPRSGLSAGFKGGCANGVEAFGAGGAIDGDPAGGGPGVRAGLG